MHIENNSLLIVPSNLKKQVIKSIKNLVNYKAMSLEEFIKKYYFDYDSETIYFLMNKYDIKYDIALMYLKNIYYIEDKKYNIEKLDKLVEIKTELEENKLLIKNDLFKESLNDKQILVYGYDYIEKPYKELLDSLNVLYIEDDTSYNNQELYEFNTSEEEIDFTISKIVELIEQGISLNDIKIVKNEYEERIKNKLDLYGINTPTSINLYGTNIIKLYLDNIENKDVFEIIKNNINLDNEINLEIYNKLINIINKYTFVDNKETIKEILINEFKKTNIIINYKEQIDYITLENNIIDKSNYVFLTDFNLGIYPSLYKDEDYITDNIKDLVNLDKTSIINKKIKESIINRIRKTNNLIITYKVKEKQEYYVSILNEELKLNPIKDYKIPYYINLDNKIKLAKKLDKLYKYNYLEEDIDLLYNNYKDINYNGYDNRYKKINRNVDELKLSYSSMDTYFKCGFKYYLDHVLKLNMQEETFSIMIGNLFHHVLEEYYKNNKDINDSYNEYLKDKEFTNKEQVFLDNLKEEIKFIIETINKQLELISLNKALYEDEVIINKNSKVKFKGYIDKLMYKEDNDKTYVAIIDYKTGNPDLNLNNTIYGLDLQLPVYLYLAKNSELKDVEILGFYLQKILNKEVNIDTKKTYIEQKEDNLKLQGYSIDSDLIELFDKTYKDSNLIKGLKIKQDGSFYSSSKILSKETIDQIINLVDMKIEEVSTKILNNEFDINPKSINDENVSCRYCNYKDICFKKNEDINYLKPYSNLEFLKEI